MKIDEFIEDRIAEIPRGSTVLWRTAIEQLHAGRAQMRLLRRRRVKAQPMAWLMAAAHWRHHQDFRPEWEL